MVTEFRRKETIFNTFLLPSKLSSSSHMIPLSLLSSPRTAFLLEADSKNDIWEVKRRIWKDYSQSNMIMKKKNPLYWVRKGKLGYSCLSTNRCLSSKCHRKHRLPLKQMGNYMGERVRTATQRKKTAVCCFFPSSILQPWSKKKKKKKSHCFALLLTEDGLLFRGAGVGTVVPGMALHPAVSDVFPERRGGQTPPGALWGPQTTPSQQTVLGLPQGEGGCCLTAPAAAAATKPKWGRSATAFILNHSCLSYHRLSSGQTIAMATIISSNLHSLLIFVPLLQSISVRVQFSFTSQFYVRVHPCLASPIALRRHFLMGWRLTIRSEDGFFC